jgi:hypothetical protein
MSLKGRTSPTKGACRPPADPTAAIKPGRPLGSTIKDRLWVSPACAMAARARARTKAATAALNVPVGAEWLPACFRVQITPPRPRKDCSLYVPRPAQVVPAQLPEPASVSSTRRFCARPCAVSFEATGRHRDRSLRRDKVPASRLARSDTASRFRHAFPTAPGSRCQLTLMPRAASLAPSPRSVRSGWPAIRARSLGSRMSCPRRRPST